MKKTEDTATLESFTEVDISFENKTEEVKLEHKASSIIKAL